jgi:hypothetical protein
MLLTIDVRLVPLLCTIIVAFAAFVEQNKQKNKLVNYLWPALYIYTVLAISYDSVERKSIVLLDTDGVKSGLHTYRREYLVKC